MTKIDIFSGFLGAGKTTLIRKLLADGYDKEKIVLIENEFGEIGIDRGFLSDAGVEITEMNSGCICCTLVGDFAEAMKKVIAEYAPDRIIIEPSGVGKLSDVAKAAAGVEGVQIDSMVAVVDPRKCRMYMENFGEFYSDQIESAGTIVVSHGDNVDDDTLAEAFDIIKEHNADAPVVATAWDALSGSQIMAEFKPGKEYAPKHDHGTDCTCGCHDHDHDHDHDHHHHGHDHHHADEIFDSVGIETIRKFTEEDIAGILEGFEAKPNILRAKGMVQSKNGGWIFFDYVPGTKDIREGSAQTVGKACVIGTGLDEAEIKGVFSL
ncbi:MAG: GTP-binding protein [Firmicutes bacterium]|nr:GTP-binding protein [Bacillota bacterium]